MNSGFKFTVHRPTQAADSDKTSQVLSISLTGAFLAFNMVVDPNYEKNLRLAKAELKLALMEAILNGEWEIVE